METPTGHPTRVLADEDNVCSRAVVPRARLAFLSLIALISFVSIAACAEGGTGGATGLLDAAGDGSLDASFDGDGEGDGTATDAHGDGLIFEVEPPEDAACPGTTCGGKCVEPKDDPLNCGACGVTCADVQFCSTEVGGPPCKCRKPMVACSGECVDRDTSPTNCGDCGVTCAAACSRGACVGACPSDRTGCPAAGGKTACVATATDPRNCGACGVTCATSQLCAAGKCVEYRPAVGCAACPCSICTALVGSTASCCPPLLGHVAAVCVAAAACP
jgi:hypothetical protein